MILLIIGLIWLGITGWLIWREQYKEATSVAPHDAHIFHSRDLLAGGLLFGLTIGFFWRTASGDVYQPADGGDLVSFLFPTYRFAAAQLQQATLPLWNPTLYGGAPFIGDIQAGFLYIPNLILFYLWPNFDYRVMQWLAVGHFYWAGLGMYVFLRFVGRGQASEYAPENSGGRWPNRQLSRPAAIFGAIAFQFADPLLLHFGNLNLIAVLSWLPWILAVYRQALVWRSLRWAGIAGFLFAFANFAGHAQSSFYIGMVLALYTLAHWALKVGDWRSAERIRRVTIPQVIAVIQYPLMTATLTTLLTAPILLPAFELARLTERSTFTYQDTVAFSLAPTQLIGLITPGFFGRGPALHWSLWSRVETPYAGVATLIFAVGALLLVNANVRRHLWAWVWIALVGFATALGIYAIIHGWLALLIPLFDQFRAPARALLLWTFGVAVLAAFGVDALQRLCGGRLLAGEQLVANETDQQLAGEKTWYQLLRWGALGLMGIAVPLSYFALLLTQENETAFLRSSIVALALTMAAGFWLGTWALIAMARHGWFRPTTLGLLLVGLLFFDLAATGAYTDISTSDPTTGYQHAAIVDFLRSDAAAPVGRIDTLTDIQGLWQPDSAALWGLEDVGGIANPLMLDHWHRLWEGLGGRQGALYDMLHVTHVIVRDGTPLPEGKFTLAFDAPDELAVYQNTEAMARGWLVHDLVAVADQQAALAALQTPTFAPATQAVMQTSEAALPPTAPATGAESVTVVERSNNQLTVAVEASAPGLLVLSEIWYPGWRATVNNVDTPVEQVNVALRGVAVPAGTNTVVLRFVPDSWRAGLLSAVAGWILLIIVFVFEKSRG